MSKFPLLKQKDSDNTENVIYDKVRTAIIERRLPAGTRLPEESLAEAFGVGRGHVRKALSRLVHDSMLTHIPNRGVFVSTPTVKEARDVFAARRVIETAIVKEAVRNITKKNLKSLHDHVRLEQQVAKKGDLTAAIRLSGEFHMAIAKIAGNAPLAQFLGDLIARSSLILSVFEKKDTIECSHTEHSAVLDMIEAGAVEEATIAMMRHLDEIEARLNLSRQQEPEVDLKSLFSD